MHLQANVGHMRIAGVTAQEGRSYYGKRGVESQRPDGRRIAARGVGWWRLGLNWPRVVAVCLRAVPARCSRLAAVGRIIP